MKVYQLKAKIIPGTSYKEVEKIALKIFKEIKSKSKRIPYIRSEYFNNEKVFLNIFWSHLHEKQLPERLRRLKYFDCALDLIKNSKMEPVKKVNPKDKTVLLYRFTGKTKGGDIFQVQIKENRKSKRKDFISILPPN